MTTTFFDIESRPAPMATLERVMPQFSAPSNYTDPAKISKAIAEKRAEWIDRAALSALTGEVVCVGVLTGDEFTCLDGGGDERKLLLQVSELFHSNGKFAGFNCRTFDAPFLIKRAWFLGVTPPIPWNYRWNSGETFTDLRDVWQCGDRQAEGSLDTISRFFGKEGKNGSGKDFHRLWETNRSAALDYLRNDLLLTKHIASMMGVF